MLVARCEYPDCSSRIYASARVFVTPFHDGVNLWLTRGSYVEFVPLLYKYTPFRFDHCGSIATFLDKQPAHRIGQIKRVSLEMPMLQSHRPRRSSPHFELKRWLDKYAFLESHLASSSVLELRLVPEHTYLFLHETGGTKRLDEVMSSGSSVRDSGWLEPAVRLPMPVRITLEGRLVEGYGASSRQLSKYIGNRSCRSSMRLDEVKTQVTETDDSMTTNEEGAAGAAAQRAFNVIREIWRARWS